MYEASKAMKRRGMLNDKLFKGGGIDIGAGPDCIRKWGYDAYDWDLKDGDAQYLQNISDKSLDFVHSSHCLEHMVDPRIAIQNWVRVVRSGGYIVITVPDEELYEHNLWPSRFNYDHKWSFRIFRKYPLHSRSLTIFDLFSKIWKEVEVLSIIRIEEGFNRSAPVGVDQTGPAEGPECAIELILRKL